MANYTVVWTTNIFDVSSPEDAAFRAAKDQAYGTSTVYEVAEGIIPIELPESFKTIDLDQPESDDNDSTN